MKLIYPLQVRFDDRRAIVTGLTVRSLTTTTTDNKNSDDWYVALQDVVMPWHVNLYVLVGNGNPVANVEWVRRSVLHALHADAVLSRSRTKRRCHHQQPELRKLTLVPVLRNVASTFTSVYDVLTASGDDAATMTQSSTLYKCRLLSAREHRVALRHLVDNAHHHQHVYALPSAVNETPHLRFVLDLYAASTRRTMEDERLERIRRRLHAATTTAGSERFYRDLIERHDDEEEEEEQDTERRTVHDLRRAFACGKWCLFDDGVDQVGTNRVVVIATPIEFRSCLDTVARVLVRDDHLHRLFATPLEYVARIVWDIETIARSPTTIPRGVRLDECLSSVCILVERPQLELNRLLVVWMLMPSGGRAPTVDEILDRDERQRLRVDLVDVRVYRDERCMLVDFLRDMIVNHTLLTVFFGVDDPSAYQDMAAFLVGHNTVDYDFRFLLQRLVFHGGPKDLISALASRCDVSTLSATFSHTFSPSHISLDTLHFLRARYPQLKSYKLGSVLKTYGCDVEKIDFPAATIRDLYYVAYDHTRLCRVLRYNAYDCLSLSSLLDRVRFASHVTVMMTYFYAPLDSVTYRGNSSLLPCRLVLETMATNPGTFATVRQPQRNVFLPPSDHGVLRDNLEQCRSLYGQSWHVLDVKDDEVAWAKPHVLLNRNDDEDNDDAVTAAYEGRVVTLPCAEIDAIRAGNKTYLGGMNHAIAGHVRYPICVDVNSFYPSVIRQKRLDVHLVFVIRLAQLLTVLPLDVIQSLLDANAFQVFDYTAPVDVGSTVDAASYERLHGHPWEEGVRVRTVDQLVVPSRRLDRPFLCVVYHDTESTIDAVVTRALHRRAELKRQKKANPHDIVLHFMEMMEKLTANSLYGYLNFDGSVVYSRATAAAVTLVCRHYFTQVRKIIESAEFLVRATGLDPSENRFRVVYVDTDGCIFHLTGVASNPYANLASAERIAAYDRLAVLINDTLGREFVKLAAENHEHVAASVFSPKKYALYRALPTEVVKRVGFDSNAAAPIRAMYELVTRNLMRALHRYGHAPSDSFRLRITRHRLFFFAVFDYLDREWSKSDRRTADFGLNRPLIPKNTGGAMSEFIVRVLERYGFNVGDRVWIYSVAELDGTSRFVLDTELTTADILDHKFFLGGYARYLYQCIEGQRTFNEPASITHEPIEFDKAGEPIKHVNSFRQAYDYSWRCWLRRRKGHEVDEYEENPYGQSLFVDTEPDTVDDRRAKKRLFDGDFLVVD